MSATFKRVAGGLGCYGVLAILSICALLPTVWVMLSSFKTGGQIFAGDGLLPRPFTLRGYADAFGQVHLERYLFNTALYAVFGSLGAVTAALLAAYPTARYRFPGSGALVASFSLALAIPVVGLATPEFFVVRQLGLFDSRIGFIVFYSALFFPLAFVILRAFLVSLPPELEEAAVVDGAGYFTIIRRIVVPVARPALATAGVIVFVSIWNEFYFANLLSASSGTQNAQIALASFRSQFNFNVGGMLAGTTVVMIVPIFMFLALQRQVIAGLTAGTGK
ncbi:Trehalose transport system permease protein SugB [Baekduia alba]|uniref:carbohydrate ABC transporter permease n=1 Tax=Baekduia alba TaxID=2997333 RepID=UPI002340BA66|nr:carbohydrate ABC transporter permease [Baekduia alba]WCB93457.1 Trehalose transport system permease protein SugB [Baekduia alba]